MLHPLNLQLNFYSPLVHLPARLLGESLALRLANTKEALEDFNCGCASVLSQLAHHQTPVVVFLVFGLRLTVLDFKTCKVALLYAVL